MLRLFDWKCKPCGQAHEALVPVPHGEDTPGEAFVHCADCGDSTAHERQMSLPAPYMGEKVLNPSVRGGNYDTMGHKALPDLPDLPGAAEHSEKLGRALSAVPDGPRRDDARRDVMAAHLKTAPSGADYATMFASPAYKEAEAAQAPVIAENKSKRARAAAIANGENVNMRRDRALGDPNITA